MEANLRLAQQATRTALQARQVSQQADEVEEAGTRLIKTINTVSFALIFFT